MSKISVFIVEDHQMVREMWVQLFSGRKEIEVVGESGNPGEAVEMIKSKRPDIVLLDINLPGSSGMELVPLIRKFAPGSKIIAVSMHNQPAYTKKMLQLGALGYVTKNSSHEEIFKAIETVMKGKTYVCMEIRNILSDQALQDEPSGPDVKELSIREIEIIRLIKEGLSSKEIAARLHISIRTAEVHRHNILKKLGLKNTASLISFINTTDLSF
ncbi:MAG TPA: response regulator transcription factor [Chitinophagaceae bacterium]|jgi:DNA-binding NarL/FixJ family response regulator|nr:response regulator transcription factor [Chitinophagaceae bacterium]